MLKSIVVHDIPMSRIAAMERWYWRDHAPEINRRFGPWLARHESFLPVDAPVEARSFGFFNWRVTEGYWRELPLPAPAAIWPSRYRRYGREWRLPSLRRNRPRTSAAAAFSLTNATHFVGTA